jgi:glycosyltransferase involved in cell wall biosynthesis
LKKSQAKLKIMKVNKKLVEEVPMRDLKVTHFFILHDEKNNPFSGAENHLWELLKGSAEVIDVELLLSTGHVGPIINGRIEELRSADVKVSLIDRNVYHFSSINYLRIIQECIIYLKQFRKRKDRILHLHLNSNTIPTTAILSGHKNIFFSFHNDEPYFKKPLSKFFLKKMFYWFRHTIAITQHVKDYLVNEVGLPGNKISVVRYGIHPPPIKELESGKIPDFPTKIKLCFIGRLNRQKNLFFFFECLKELPEVSLVLFGEGPEKESLKNKAIESGLGTRIYFYGYLDSASSYIHQFDFLCLPSQWEGLGLVLIEAMYQKTAIIGSDAGAIPEVLNHGQLGTIISYSNKEKAVNVLKKAFGNTSNTNDMKDKAFEYAQKNYTVERMVEQTIAIYQEFSKTFASNK